MGRVFTNYFNASALASLKNTKLDNATQYNIQLSDYNAGSTSRAKLDRLAFSRFNYLEFIPKREDKKSGKSSYVLGANFDVGVFTGSSEGDVGVKPSDGGDESKDPVISTPDDPTGGKVDFDKDVTAPDLPQKTEKLTPDKFDDFKPGKNQIRFEFSMKNNEKNLKNSIDGTTVSVNGSLEASIPFDNIPIPGGPFSIAPKIGGGVGSSEQKSMASFANKSDQVDFQMIWRDLKTQSITPSNQWLLLDEISNAFDKGRRGIAASTPGDSSGYMFNSMAEFKDMKDNYLPLLKLPNGDNAEVDILKENLSY